MISKFLTSGEIYSQNDFYSALLTDLANAKMSILIESPFITSRRLNDLITILGNKSRNGLTVVVNTRHPREYDHCKVRPAYENIAALQDAGLNVLYTGRLHRKVAIIDSEIVWNGSLNILSQNDSCEIMMRMKSERLAHQLLQFIELKHL